MKKKNIYFKDDYLDYVYSGFFGYLMKKSHEKMESNISKNLKIKKILEIGGGFSPHINFISQKNAEYTNLDLKSVTGLNKFYKKKYKNIKFKYYDGKKIPFRKNSFDRIIISHCLEHILDPETFLNETLRVTKKGGIISIALPCDPGIMWRMGRFFQKIFYINKIKMKDYDYKMAKEHVNSIFNLIPIIKTKFKIIRKTYYPFNLNLVDINLFYIVDLKK